MSAERPVHRQRPLMDIGDPRRPLIGRAVFGTLAAAAVFFVFTATKQIKPLYVHAPWLKDPYDTVFSFTMFFVPLIAAALLMQVSLCRKSEPLPASRVITILRGCRVAIGAIVVELLTAWIAVILGANWSAWTVSSTGIQIALLVTSTLVTGRVTLDLCRAPRLRESDLPPNAQTSDWLADLIAVAARESRWLGPLRRSSLNLVSWIDRGIVRTVRRHPLIAAAVTSAAFGVTVFGYQGLREGYLLSVTLLSMALGFCGMFASLVLAGSYMRLVRSPGPLHGARRRAVDAFVAACIAVIVALAFRDSLWWVIGSNASSAGPAQFATLIASAGVLSFATILVLESVVRSHSGLADNPAR
jgi:hypothetical protein